MVRREYVSIPDGLTEIRQHLPTAAKMIEHAARWVHPDTFGALPVWYPDTARGRQRYDANWLEPLLSRKGKPKLEQNVQAGKALVCALGVRPSAKPSSWTVCHIWGYDDDRFATESMIVKDPRYYSCIGNMVWLPTPLKGFTDAVPEIKRMLRTCAYYLYGWAPRTLIETELAETKVIPGGYPESWPTADRNSPPRGTSPYSQCVKDAVERRKRQLRMRLANKALTHYPRQEVRDVLAFWHVEDV